MISEAFWSSSPCLFSLSCPFLLPSSPASPASPFLSTCLHRDRSTVPPSPSLIMSPVMKPLVFCASVLAMVNAFDGDGTFYGAGGAGRGGACQMDNRGVGVTAALNAAQYGGGENCGQCIRVTGRGEGGGANPIIGPIYAIIDNECPECQFGDVDFGLGGDGRWRIQWNFVSCDEARRSGSNLPAMRRSLRAVLSEEAAKAEGTYLPPGYMVTADGIKAIDTNNNNQN